MYALSIGPLVSLFPSLSACRSRRFRRGGPYRLPFIGHGGQKSPKTAFGMAVIRHSEGSGILRTCVRPMGILRVCGRLAVRTIRGQKLRTIGGQIRGQFLVSRGKVRQLREHSEPLIFLNKICRIATKFAESILPLILQKIMPKKIQL